MNKIPIRQATFVWSDNPHSFCVCRQGEGPYHDYSDGCVWSAWRAAPEAELWIALLVLIDRCVTVYKLNRDTIEKRLVDGLQDYANIGDRLDRWQFEKPKKAA